MIGRHRALIPCFRTGDVGAGGHSTFHAEGPVRLTRGTIRSSLDLTGAHLILGEPRAEAEDEQTAGWFALDAAMMRIRERLVLRYRDDALVSIGVANANGTSAIALGEPARVASEQPEGGTLESLSARMPVGYGDLEIVDAETGTYVFIRREVRDGTRSAHYIAVPPGVVGAWLAAAQAGGWVWPIGGQTVSGAQFFRFVTTAGREVGVATCKGDLSCTSTIRGTASATSAGEHISSDQLMAVAPEAVR